MLSETDVLSDPRPAGSCVTSPSNTVTVRKATRRQSMASLRLICDHIWPIFGQIWSDLVSVWNHRHLCWVIPGQIRVAVGRELTCSSCSPARASSKKATPEPMAPGLLYVTACWCGGLQVRWCGGPMVRWRRAHQSSTIVQSPFPHGVDCLVVAKPVVGDHPLADVGDVAGL